MKNLTPSDAKLNITLVRSVACRTPAQRETVRSLGLKRIGHTVERTADAVTVGMVNKVKHMVEVEEAK